MLAAAIKQHVDAVAAAITPKGSRPPFTRKISAREAFEWWLKHRYDPVGLAEYGKMAPLQQQELDAWLAQATSGAPASAPTPPVNDVNAVLRPAQIQERKLEGPPVTGDVS
jgi:hypothetical protein